MKSALASTRNAIAARLGEMSFSRTELAGSLGDLGTFLPLTLGVAAVCGLDFGRVLLFAGAFNIVTGLIFRVPMCVQPMKAIATLAIAQQLSAGEVMAAGLIAGATVLVLAACGLVARLAAIIPASVAAGIQLGLAAKLAWAAVGMSFLGQRMIGWDSWGAALIVLVILLALANSQRIPGALVVFVLGLGVAMARLTNAGAVSPAVSAAGLPLLSGFSAAAWHAAATQVPLTVTNSVLAVCALSARLFPDRPASVQKVAVSVGTLNILGFMFGGQPMCHGAGGLAGQYRFGARTAGSMVMLGGVKIVCGLLFAGYLFHLFSVFPASVLGIMLLFSSFELAKAARNQTTIADLGVCLVTAILMFTIGAGPGLVAGVAVGILQRRLGLNRSDVGAMQPVGLQIR